MKAALVRLPVVLALMAVPALDASAATHTLSYLDSSHNVCSIRISDTGAPIGKPVRITSGGGYDTYSVSPDRKWVAGLIDIGGPNLSPAWEWKCFVERVGQGRLKRYMRITSDGQPILWWSERGNYLLCWGGQVAGTTRCYDLRAGRETFATDDDLLTMSYDERCALVLESVGCCGEGRADLSVADLRTGRTRKLGRIMHETNYCVWLGKSHNCAFIDVRGNAWVARIGPGSRGINLSLHRLTRYGHCSDLRAAGSALYFVQTAAGRNTAYYSYDLKTLRQGKMLAAKPEDEGKRPEAMSENLLPRNAWRSCALTTADGNWTACPIDAGECKMPLLKVFDRKGRAHVITKGKMPMWLGAGEMRRSSYDELSNYKLDRWSNAGRI